MTMGHCAFLAVPYSGTSSLFITGGRLSTATKSRATSRPRRPFVPIRAAVDPSFVNHAVHAVPAVHHAMDLHSASHLLATAAAAISDTATAASDAVPLDPAVAEDAVKSGPIQSLANVIEYCLTYLQLSLRGAGVSGGGGLAIIALTTAIKGVLFPLNWKQMESTIAMQAISPRLKAIQAEYKDNPAVINQMTAKLYKDENINPLLGCLPILLQLPIWLALYRALQNMAKDNLLNEPFLWVPSLQGPVSKVGESLSVWLFPLVDGHPPIGWHDAICYLVLPLLIVSSQIITTKIVSPTNPNDQSAKQANAFNNFLPIIVGWFVLNVPSALGLYMLTNNILTTAQTLFVKSRLPTPAAAAVSGGNGTVAPVSTLEMQAADGFKDEDDEDTGNKSSKANKGKSKKSKRRKRR